MLKQGERERLRDGQEIDRAGLTLADACRVLLEAPASARRRRLFARVERSRLLAAVTAIEGLALSPDDRARELILTRHRGVRRYLPLLLDTIDFQATEAGGRSSRPSTRWAGPPGAGGLSPHELPTESSPRVAATGRARDRADRPGRLDHVRAGGVARRPAPPRHLRRPQRTGRRPPREPARRAHVDGLPDRCLPIAVAARGARIVP